MKIKTMIKKMIGQKKFNKIKKNIYFLIIFCTRKLHINIKTNKEYVEKKMSFYQKGKNIFCGYYDVQPLKNNLLLVETMKKGANPKKDKAEIGIYDINYRNNYKVITDTFAWSWQQGSRLRWSNDDNYIFFNDYVDGKYCCKKYNIQNNEEKVIPYPLYDIDRNEQKGISINFSRLQRLRPGYGYCNIIDKTMNNKAPKDDGVFLIDLNTFEKKLLISLEELAKISDDNKVKFEHYINHISFSPNGNLVMFFHIWNSDENPVFKWKTQLCIYDIENEKIDIIEKNDIVSHYNWIDNEKLLITGTNLKSYKGFYRIYDLKNKNKKEIKDEMLLNDGHPTMTSNSSIFISDTYPNKYSFQNLFMYDIKNNKYCLLLKVLAKYSEDPETRCDLHPKIMEKENIVAIDTTYRNDLRSVLLIKIRMEGNNGKKKEKII